MECMCAYWGSPKINVQNKWKKILSYRIIRIKRIFFRSLLMYNLDQFTHKQIKVRSVFWYVSLWYNCSIVIIFYFPCTCISLFYYFVCTSHLCILSYMHVPYGAFFIHMKLSWYMIYKFYYRIKHIFPEFIYV
jgi:hypothetical protein